jgi:hypothetical protein
MRRSSFRLSIATLLVTGGCAAALALVSSGNAGSSGASTLTLFAHPTTLTTSTQAALSSGFVKAAFKAAGPDSGIGSATHVVITVTLPSALAFDQSHSSAGCATDPATPANDVVCAVGTVNAGVTVNRFVTFTAPTTAPSGGITYPIKGSAVQDNGTGGNGGGGGSVNTPITAPDVQVSVFAGTDPSHAGGCFFSGGTTHTPSPNASDNQSTSAAVGTAASSLGIPCAYADIGEDGEGGQVGHGFSTAISHDNIANLTAPATITITLYSLPKPFSQLIWHFIADYSSLTALNDISTYPKIANCQNGTLPANATVPCLLSSSNKGQGATWTFLQNGTGSDPGYGS